MGVSMTQNSKAQEFGKYKAPKRAGELKRRSLAIFAIVALVWLVLDQATKALANAQLTAGQATGDIIPGVFHLTLTANTGGAWSILSDATWLLVIFSLVVCLLIIGFIVYKGQYISIAENIGLGLVCGGGIGNMIDRIIAGQVTDFIDLSFMSYPVFNVADIGVVCGVVIFIVAYLIRLKKSPQEQKDSNQKGIL